ncbi:MAG: VOC family protein [Acidobacteriota bacterium]|jgi:catechol 2,3-dioxygenase-like lactoylglutathione lyase family enzyme
MEIEQFRVTLRAREYERTCRFYGETLALPRIDTWEEDDLQGSVYQAGPGVITVLGRRPNRPRRPDEDLFEYRGPAHEMEIVLAVASPNETYDELIFRQHNIPGGMRVDEDGAEIFETRDPDGVRIIFRKP